MNYTLPRFATQMGMESRLKKVAAEKIGLNAIPMAIGKYSNLSVVKVKTRFFA